MASAICVGESKVARLFRLGCSTVAVLAALLFVVAALSQAFHATGAHSTLMGALLTSMAAVLLLATCWSLNDAAHGRFAALLAGIGSFVTLAFCGGGVTTQASAYGAAGLNGPISMASLIACTIISTQISARMMQTAACKCD